MPVDPHLNPGEGERYRRYARFRIDPLGLYLFNHDLFFQPKEYDVLYGDIYRNFAPLTTAQIQNRFLRNLIQQSFFALPRRSLAPFEVSVHMIRIQATPNSEFGRPAPEGIHRDGYHFGSIHLMNRANLRGAVNRIYDTKQNLVDQMTLKDPMDSIYFDDEAILHGVSPFRAADPNHVATRDMLILLYQPVSESPQRDSQFSLVESFATEKISG